MTPRILPALLLAATLPGAADAATLTWPGDPGCTGTLQACVDAATDGDRIEIATHAPITEGLALHARSLTVTAADGYRPLFQGAGIIANDAGGSGDITVRVSRLRFDNGFVYMTYSGSGTATFELRGLVMTRPPGTVGNAIQVIAYGGTVEATLYDNRITGAPLSFNSGLIQLAATGGMLHADAYYNHVQSTVSGSTDGAGIFVDVAGAGSGATVKLHANEVRGRYDRAGIFLSEGLFSSSAVEYEARVYSNVVVGNGTDGGSGIVATATNGRIDAQIVNNTLTRLRNGIMAVNWNDAETPRVTGLVQNNLVRAERALFVNPGVADGLTNDYNLFNGAVINTTPGAHTITAPAGLASDARPRLAAGSPAIDAADTGTLGFGLIFNALPVTDADGLRRIKNPSGTGPDKADIGAYEFGDVSFVHTTTAANTDDYISDIDDASVNGRPAADLFLTPNFDGGDNPAQAFDRPFGSWYAGPHWTVFDQGFAAMPEHVDFDVFAPAQGGGVFRHVADAENTSDWFSQLDDGSVNDLPDRIVLVAQNWSAGPVYNAHPVGVFHFSFGGPGAWMVGNLDMVDLPVGAGFSVYAQEPSPNAFRVTAGAANTAGSGLVLEHPLLDGVACAQPMVTRLFDGNAVAGHFDVDYYDGRWRIFAYDGMPAGTQFHVLVNPAQVEACNDVIFADGFED